MQLYIHKISLIWNNLNSWVLELTESLKLIISAAQRGVTSKTTPPASRVPWKETVLATASLIRSLLLAKHRHTLSLQGERQQGHKSRVALQLSHQTA